MNKEEDLAIINETRVKILKSTFKRVTEKREKKVIDRLVNAYRDNELTQEMAYSAIMAIAELRWASGDIGKEHLI